MVITLEPDLESALNDLAQKQNVVAEDLVIMVLRERFLVPTQQLQPRDDWERSLLAIASDCGVSLSNEAVGSEGLYE